MVDSLLSGMGFPKSYDVICCQWSEWCHSSSDRSVLRMFCKASMYVGFSSEFLYWYRSADSYFLYQYLLFLGLVGKSSIKADKSVDFRKLYDVIRCYQNGFVVTVS